nr:MAG TPA: hypothetical protein [Caudoviricetes sp.]
MFGSPITNNIKSYVPPEFLDTTPLPLEDTFPLLTSFIKVPEQYIG